MEREAALVSGAEGTELRGGYLQVVVQRCDLGAGVVVNMCYPGGVIQVSVEELQMLAQAVPGGHSAAQPVVSILDGPAGSFAVDPLQQPCREGGAGLTLLQGSTPGGCGLH